MKTFNKNSTLLHIFSSLPVFTIKSLKKKLAENLKLASVEKLFQYLYLLQSVEKELSHFSLSISTEKTQKYPLPWRTFHLKLFHTWKVIKIPHKSLKTFTIATMEHSLLNIYENPEKMPTRSFWTCLYLTASIFILFYKSKISRRYGIYKILTQNQIFYDCWLEGIINERWNVSLCPGISLCSRLLYFINIT